jgi:5,10-methylenetetrahydromethanopterin reductase
LKIGLVLNGRRSASEIAELAQLAEQQGFAHLWLSGGSRTKDHFLRLASAATRTRRIQIGPVAISPFEMHPVRIGLSLLTLDEMADGRASIVLGGGGDLAGTLNIPLKNRVQAVAETIDLIHLIGRGGEVSYRGHVFQTRELFSPWQGATVPPLYIGANRPKMLQMAAEKANGVMVTDMPPSNVKGLVHQVKQGLLNARRDFGKFKMSNWFVWNIQDTEEEALRLARRTLGFRLYYIRDLAASIGLTFDQAVELKKKQPDMIRAVFEGRDPYTPSRDVTKILVDQLTITGSWQHLDKAVERLHEFEKQGLNEMALAVEGNPVSAIKLLGEKVLPVVQGEAVFRGAAPTL